MVGLGLVAFLSLVAVYVGPRPGVETQTLPDGFSDSEFWRLIGDLSEPGGYFRSDNFVSNETTFQYVIPELTRRTKPGGVYLGVGPDQNFTYIAALQPKLAFVTDIRRNNMLLHLMYKALFELSENRAEFLSKLFSRPMPKSLTKSFTTEQLFEAFTAEKADQAMAKKNLEAVLDRLGRHHKFSLSLEDVRNIEYVHDAFGSQGPQIRYSYPNQYTPRRFPTYSELMLEADEEGVSHSYMASEENFQLLKKLQLENRIVPIVGDFAGEKALRSVGRFLKEHGATVTAFYTSNVEYYLFQTGDWRKFLANVAGMPMDDHSFFIRAYFNTYGYRSSNQASNPQPMTLLDSMPGLVAEFETGRIRNYTDVVKRPSY